MKSMRHTLIELKMVLQTLGPYYVLFPPDTIPFQYWSRNALLKSVYLYSLVVMLLVGNGEDIIGYLLYHLTE